MKFDIPVLAFLFICLLGCNDSKDKLFWIKENTEHRSDFLFMAESTNVQTITADSLKFFLSTSELENMDTALISFKNFGKIFEGEKFKVFVLLQTMNCLDRNYTFVIRTYDKNFNFIDSFELALWDKNENQFCFGSIDKDLVIERKCNYSDGAKEAKIREDGRIEIVSEKNRMTN